jgi:hypothetical protein
MFDSLSFQDARPIALLKKAILILLALCVVTALVSGYRAYYQVRSLELQLTEPILRNGSVVQIAVVGSGRTTIDVRLELIQGAHSETLAVQHLPGNAWASFDPRSTRGSYRVMLTPALLARFHNGPAKVQAIATGRPQWTRLPPPEVREVTVEIQHEVNGRTDKGSN